MGKVREKIQNHQFNRRYIALVQTLVENPRRAQQGIAFPCQAPLQGNGREIRMGCDRFHDGLGYASISASAWPRMCKSRTELEPDA
jgi:hypothetical protein